MSANLTCGLEEMSSWARAGRRHLPAARSLGVCLQLRSPILGARPAVCAGRAVPPALRPVEAQQHRTSGSKAVSWWLGPHPLPQVEQGT